MWLVWMVRAVVWLLWLAGAGVDGVAGPLVWRVYFARTCGKDRFDRYVAT